MSTFLASYHQHQLRVAEANALMRRGSTVSLHSGSPGRWSPLEASTRSRPLRKSSNFLNFNNLNLALSRIIQTDYNCQKNLQFGPSQGHSLGCFK
jgi:hypothetical protein